MCGVCEWLINEVAVGFRDAFGLLDLDRAKQQYRTLLFSLLVFPHLTLTKYTMNFHTARSLAPTRQLFFSLRRIISITSACLTSLLSSHNSRLPSPAHGNSDWEVISGRICKSASNDLAVVCQNRCMHEMILGQFHPLFLFF